MLVNYMRNSVKVTVDAYDGTMTYYADLDEPIVAGVEPRLPGTVHRHRRPSPTRCTNIFRYPENLFQVQATRYTTYHVSDPAVFYQNQDRWEIAPDPTRGEFSQLGTTDDLARHRSAAPPVLPADAGAG